MLQLEPRKEFTFPVIPEHLNPDILVSEPLEKIEKTVVWEGNKERTLADLFTIRKTDGEDAALSIVGNVSRVNGIGAGMSQGEITIKGDVGSHLGERMKGGKITVDGNVAGWLGSAMMGGTIEIFGNVGDYLAAPYRGSSRGMRGGSIIVHGNVRDEAGARMKHGTIKIYGNAGQFTGCRMSDGTIYVRDQCANRAGAFMIGGKIIVAGRMESVLPTFTIDGIRPKVKIDDAESVAGPFYVLLGDRAEQGDGKLYVSKDKNPQLSIYERLL